MKKCSLVGICLFMLCQILLAQDKPFIPKVNLSAYSLRRGTPNFMWKISRNDTVKVAYLGGSITAQTGWRVNSLNYFKSQYPNAYFKEINAAIGGTGSDLGVLRVSTDVLSKKPDLVFVEFAVNDSKTDSLKIINAMEGIVRKIWKQNLYCDICFVYTFKNNMCPDYEKGHHYYSSACMEQVANYYQIPSIFMGYEAIELKKKGKLVVKRPNGFVSKVSGNSLNETFEPAVEPDGKIYFSTDGVHPYLNTGHVLYSKAVTRAFDALKHINSTSPGRLETPLHSGHYGNTSTVNIEDVTLKNNFTSLPKDNSMCKMFGNRLPSLWKAEPNSTIELKFKGRTLLGYDLLGPGGARLLVNVDGKKHTVDRFDGYCTYWRLGLVVFAENLDPDKWHSVKIEVAKEFPNKKEILFDSNKKDYEKNPAKYSGMDWYLGNFFVIR